MVNIGQGVPVPYIERSFCHGLAAVETDEQKLGFIDPNGEFVIAARFDSANGFREECALVSVNELYGFIGPDEAFRIPLSFQDANSFSEDLASVSDEDGAWHINLEGERVFGPFGWARSFYEGLALVSPSGKFGDWAFLEKSGKLTTLTGFDLVGICCRYGRITATINGKRGFLDRHGNVVISPRFDKVRMFREGRAPVQVNGKLVIPPRFDSAEMFSEGLAAVELEGKSACVRPDGEIAFFTEYKGATMFSEGRAAVYLDA